MDLRPGVSAISPDTIADGALAKVDTVPLSFVSGKLW